jgi:hypothetical protein
VLESTARIAIFDMTMKDRWTLAPDGKTLTMSRHVKGPLGASDQTLIFTKE